MTAAPPTESEFLLLIADISGYTRFMMKNHTARVHAHGIISDLIAAVIAEVRIPLEVNKLEGDAIFMIAARQEHDWNEIGGMLGQKLAEFVVAFDRKLTELAKEVVTGVYIRPEQLLLILDPLKIVAGATRESPVILSK